MRQEPSLAKIKAQQRQAPAEEPPARRPLAAPCQRQVAAPEAQHPAAPRTRGEHPRGKALSPHSLRGGDQARPENTQEAEPSAAVPRRQLFKPRSARCPLGRTGAAGTYAGYLMRPAVAGRTRQPPAPLAPSNLEAGVWHQREPRAVSPPRKPAASGPRENSEHVLPAVLSSGSLCRVNPAFPPSPPSQGCAGFPAARGEPRRRWQRLPRLR